MEVTIYEDEHGVPKVQVKSDSSDTQEVAKVYKAIRKELKEEDK